MTTSEPPSLSDLLKQVIEERDKYRSELGMCKIDTDERNEIYGELAQELIGAMPFLRGPDPNGRMRCNCIACIIHRGMRALLTANNLDEHSRSMRSSFLAGKS